MLAGDAILIGLLFLHVAQGLLLDVVVDGGGLQIDCLALYVLVLGGCRP